MTGGLGNSAAEKAVFRYDIMRNAWVIEPVLNEARAFHSSCSLSEAVYVFCGCNASMRSLNSIEKLSLHSGIWRLIQVANKVLSPRTHPAVAVLNASEIVILGGVEGIPFI